MGGTDLYQLIDDANAPGLFEQLGRKGIFVRRFTDRPRWLRIGLPGSPADFHRLEEALA